MHVQSQIYYKYIFTYFLNYIIFNELVVKFFLINYTKDQYNLIYFNV